MDMNYSRQMLCQWYARAAYLIAPLVELMFEKILQSDYVMADETTLPMLKIADKESGSNGYMCVIKQGGPGFNLVYCFATSNRKQETISNKLSKFKGHLQTDGLNFYFKLQKQTGVSAVGCWSHARRKFVHIVQLSGKMEGAAFEVIQKIKKLYVIEKKGKALSAAALYKLRQTKAVPILKELHDYLKQINAPPKSNLGNAVAYALERWDALTEYVKHAKLAIDNNATERCIKHFVIGRKNWLFADTEESGNGLGVLYSIVITCKINNVNPQLYLEYILAQLPYINKHNKRELEELLPDRFKTDKRFDVEYRSKHGIVEMSVDNETEKASSDTVHMPMAA
jgi:transposase